MAISLSEGEHVSNGGLVTPEYARLQMSTRGSHVKGHGKNLKQVENILLHEVKVKLNTLIF